MRRLLLPLGLIALAAVLVVGLVQAGGRRDAGAPAPAIAAESPARVQARLARAPGALGALYRRAPGGLVPADAAELRATLRALRGHPVVLNKWASWCGPCRAEFPAFQRAAARLGTRVAFLGVNSGHDDQVAARRFLRAHPVPYPSLVDADGSLARAAQAGNNFPTTVFYDRRGRIAFVHQGGYPDEAGLLADVRRYAGA